ncbi:Bet v1-like protein [Glarea lozoyensis ATCC 20868]|uniref:Choline monooxygenase, chloroplastic n=1 Tax=Glarea lozoyensis (strain ATCC 20868 / MF5171) TaxID=1116229 RepID=S3DYI7_GLAL2|nr:Bet v1-like protein [Glarea lozoyensis ATCC 20868]EPE37006.1 Bet v1-like protein [Glarea lozoyensis ATCC 20868]
MDSLTRTLPASWFCSEPLYQLERKGVFQKSWHLLGPVTRFQDRSKKVKYEIAQTTLIVENRSPESDGIGKDGIVVYAEDQSIEIKSHFTPSGLLFATLSTKAPDFDDYFTGLEDLINKVDFSKLPHRRSISYEGKFNWKTMIDGFQECLHCQYTHPTFTAQYPPTTYLVTNHVNFSRHLSDPSKTTTSDGLFLYFFPICTLNVYGGGMSSFRTCPSTKPGVARMEFDYYHAGTDEEFEKYYKFVRQVALEDFELCERAQMNLESGVYGEGILNPIKENGVAFYQGRVKEMVYRQHEEDQKERAEMERMEDKCSGQEVNSVEVPVK